VGAGVTRTRGAPRAALRREVGAGAAATCVGPGAALSREGGVRAAVTRGGPGAAGRRVPLHLPLFRALSGHGGAYHAPR
jgi:hypothetical protein